MKSKLKTLNSSTEFKQLVLPTEDLILPAKTDPGPPLRDLHLGLTGIQSLPLLVTLSVSRSICQVLRDWISAAASPYTDLH